MISSGGSHNIKGVTFYWEIRTPGSQNILGYNGWGSHNFLGVKIFYYTGFEPFHDIFGYFGFLRTKSKNRFWLHEKDACGHIKQNDCKNFFSFTSLIFDIFINFCGLVSESNVSFWHKFLPMELILHLQFHLLSKPLQKVTKDHKRLWSVLMKSN